MLLHLYKNNLKLTTKNQQQLHTFSLVLSLFALCLLFLSCQGFNERIPSSAVFEIQTKDDLSSTALDSDSKQAQSAQGRSKLKSVVTTKALRRQRSHFSLSLDELSRSKLNLDQNAALTCEWSKALKSLDQEIPISINLEIIRSQSQLWLETKLPIKFKKALSSAYDHLPSYSPLNDQGGLWVLYSPLNRPQQSLLLAKPIPWMNDRAKVIARCKKNKKLTELTFVPLSLDKSFKPNHKLSLVSQELQVHSTTDKE